MLKILENYIHSDKYISELVFYELMSNIYIL